MLRPSYKRPENETKCSLTTQLLRRLLCGDWTKCLNLLLQSWLGTKERIDESINRKPRSERDGESGERNASERGTRAGNVFSAATTEIQTRGGDATTVLGPVVKVEPLWVTEVWTTGGRAVTCVSVCLAPDRLFVWPKSGEKQNRARSNFTWARRASPTSLV